MLWYCVIAYVFMAYRILATHDKFGWQFENPKTGQPVSARYTVILLIIFFILSPILFPVWVFMKARKIKFHPKPE